MLQQTEMPCTTTTKILRTTKTAQTWHTHVTHSLILWVPDLSTFQILDYRTETFDRRITTQTTVDWELYWRNQDSTNTWRLQTSAFWCEITVHQYSTSTGPGLHWDRHQQLYYWTTAVVPSFIETSCSGDVKDEILFINILLKSICLVITHLPLFYSSALFLLFVNTLKRKDSTCISTLYFIAKFRLYL